VYHAPPSPNSRRVRMFLAEKGISLPLVSIDLAYGVHTFYLCNRYL
jgi:glutathione S-transferase